MARKHSTIPASNATAPALPKGNGHSLITIKVHPKIWYTAMRLANSNAQRIQIHSAESVTVHNSESWRKNA